MNLTSQEVERMEYLLGKSRLSYLTKKEESILRDLIVKENPSAKDNSLDDLIKLGLTLVGLYVLAKALDEK
ncbi:Uncharacterised protein [uncultured archaeon]|nr:Uncharacterised protein [uncultured archaeon]